MKQANAKAKDTLRRTAPPAKAPATTERAGTLAEVVSAPLSKVRPGKNVRTLPDPYHGPSEREEPSPLWLLAESMRTEGQIVPVLLEPKSDGALEIVCGHRRVEAARRLGWESVRALLLLNPDDRRRFAVMCGDNVARKNLAPPELMDLCVRGRAELDMTPHQIGTSVGLSRSAVSNYIRVSEKVHPAILEAWRKSPAFCAVRDLLELSTASVDEQLAWHRERTSDAPPADPPDPASARRRRSAPEAERKRKMAPRHEQVLVLQHLREGSYARKHPEYVRGAIDALLFSLGSAPMPGMDAIERER